MRWPRRHSPSRAVYGTCRCWRRDCRRAEPIDLAAAFAAGIARAATEAELARTVGPLHGPWPYVEPVVWHYDDGCDECDRRVAEIREHRKVIGEARS